MRVRGETERTPSGVNVNTVVIVLVIAFLAYERFARTPSKRPEATGLHSTAYPIAEALEGDRAKLRAIGDFYAQFADVMRRDGEGDSQVTTLSVFRTAHSRALRTAFRKTGIEDGEQVGKHIDAVFEEALGGKRDMDVTPEVRAKIIDAMEAIAWVSKTT